MKILFFLILFPIFIIGCAGSKYELPNSKLIIDEETYGMSRAEVINAIKECEGSETIPSMIFGKRKVGGKITDLVVDVTCMPDYLKFMKK